MRQAKTGTCALTLTLVLIASGCAGAGPSAATPQPASPTAPDAAPDGAQPPDAEGPVDELIAYGAAHPDAFAGLYMDPPGSGRFVMLFISDLDAHAEAVRAIDPSARVERARFTEAELTELLESAMTALSDTPGVEPIAGGVDTIGNVVTIDVKSDDPTLEVRVELQYGGRVDLTVHPVPGPWTNAAAGEGWHLLGAGAAGHGEAYTVRAATDPAAYAVLWEAAGFGDEGPAVDFGTEVVVSFAHGIGSSCPELRLDSVHIGDGVVFSVVSDPLEPRACTADLTGAATFVVAIERSSLPAERFTLQLREDSVTCADCGFTEQIEVELP
jgi:hypothetical protein